METNKSKYIIGLKNEYICRSIYLVVLTLLIYIPNVYLMILNETSIIYLLIAIILFFLFDLIIDTFLYITIKRKETLVLNDKSFFIEINSRLEITEEEIFFKNIIDCKVRFSYIPCYEVLQIQTVQKNYNIEKAQLGSEKYQYVKQFILERCKKEKTY